MITNWVTTYGEAIVRVPQRAFAWRANTVIGDNATYVVSSPLPPCLHCAERMPSDCTMWLPSHYPEAEGCGAGLLASLHGLIRCKTAVALIMSMDSVVPTSQNSHMSAPV